MRIPVRLYLRHLQHHWVRSLLTVISVVVACGLLCMLLSLVTSLEAAVRESSGDRVMTQSAVSLFVSLPANYQEKIAGVPGVERVTKFQWFGGYFQDPKNFFAQFGIDPDEFAAVYGSDFEITELRAEDAGAGGSQPPGLAAAIALLKSDRRAAIVGEGIARDFGWKPGDKFPLISTLFRKDDGSAWEFELVAIYKPLRANFDDRTVFFRFDYIDESLAQGAATGPRGCGVYVSKLAPGNEPGEVIARIDRLFENGPQATRTFTEAAFQAGFISMMGNLPLFLGSIGGAGLFAVLFSLVNTMLLSTRQRTREFGTLKALGFRRTSLAVMMVFESLTLTVAGGAIAMALSFGSQEAMRARFATVVPTYHVADSTYGWMAAVALLVGLVAGILPAVIVHRTNPVAALRSEE